MSDHYAKPASRASSDSEAVEPLSQRVGDRTPTSVLVVQARKISELEAVRIEALHAAGPEEGTFVLEELAERLTKLQNALTSVLDRLEEAQRAVN